MHAHVTYINLKRARAKWGWMLDAGFFCCLSVPVVLRSVPAPAPSLALRSALFTLLVPVPALCVFTPPLLRSRSAHRFATAPLRCRSVAPLLWDWVPERPQEYMRTLYLSTNTSHFVANDSQCEKCSQHHFGHHKSRRLHVHVFCVYTFTPTCLYKSQTLLQKNIGTAENLKSSRQM